MSDSAADIERESEQRRANIAALVDELRDRVTPGEVVNQLLGPDAGRDLMEATMWEARRQLRQNPVPVAMIASGLAWILLANALRRQRELPVYDGLDYERYGELESGLPGGMLGGVRRRLRFFSEAHERDLLMAAREQEETMTHSGKSGRERIVAGEAALQETVNGNGPQQAGFVARSVQKGREAAKSAVTRTQQKATGLAHAALQKSGEALGDAADAVGETASSIMERTNAMARRTGRAAGSTAKRAGSGIGDLAREQPLLVAGVGFAIGVALGALLPLSRLENSMLGEQAEKLKDRARKLADEGYEKVKSVAQRTYDAATEGLQSESDKSDSTTIASTSEKAVGAHGSEGASDAGANAYRH